MLCVSICENLNNKNHNSIQPRSVSNCDSLYNKIHNTIKPRSGDTMVALIKSRILSRVAATDLCETKKQKGIDDSD